MVELRQKSSVKPSIIVAIGGGVTMDTAKASAIYLLIMEKLVNFKVGIWLKNLQFIK